MGFLEKYFTSKAERSISVRALEQSIENVQDTRVLVDALTDELEAKEKALSKSEKKYKVMYELMASVIDAIP